MSDIEEIDDISQNGDEEVDSVVASDVESDIEGSDVEGSEVGSDDDGSDIDGELSEEDPVNEEPQDHSQSQGGSFLDMLGGAPPDEILMLHPESTYHNYDEISAAALVTRNENNIIVDKLHRSLPILTKYEKAKVLGQRTKQLNMGSTPFVGVDRMTMDNSIIAEEELKAKKMPFIIQRPMPGGGVEYWHVKDLEVV